MTVKRYRSSDDKPECPNCGYKAFCVIEDGGVYSIDTIGQIFICSTDNGTYLHGWKTKETPDDIKELADNGLDF